MSPKSTASLVYVVERFPSLCETAVVREMLALEADGVSVRPLSLRRPAGKSLPAGSEHLAPRTLYMPAALSPVRLLAILALLRRPTGLLLGLRLCLRLCIRFPRHAPEVLSAYAAACYAAALLPRSVRHVHCDTAARPATVAMVLAEVLAVGYSIALGSRDIFLRTSSLLGPKLAEAEFVTVSTRYTLNRLLRQHRLVAERCARVIYRGVDLAIFRPVALRAPRAPVLLSVGALEERKGHATLLEALAILRSRGCQCRLRIVGDGVLREQLLSRTTRLGLADRVELCGELPQELLLQAYAEADVFALPSVVADDGDRDSMPSMLLEALASGLPTVASDISAVPEVIEHGVTGLLARPGDAEHLADMLETAMFDQAVRERLSVCARERVAADFDARAHLRALVTLVRQAMER